MKTQTTFDEIIESLELDKKVNKRCTVKDPEDCPDPRIFWGTSMGWEGLELQCQLGRISVLEYRNEVRKGILSSNELCEDWNCLYLKEVEEAS